MLREYYLYAEAHTRVSRSGLRIFQSIPNKAVQEEIDHLTNSMSHLHGSLLSSLGEMPDSIPRDYRKQFRTQVNQLFRQYPQLYEPRNHHSLELHRRMQVEGNTETQRRKRKIVDAAWSSDQRPPQINVNLENPNVKRQRTSPVLDGPSSSEILLNDDCLMEIFSWLPSEDLTLNVTACSRHFNKLTTDVLRLRSRKFKFDYCNNQDWVILKRFGKIIEEVEVYSSSVIPDLYIRYEWMKYCHSLKTLVVRDLPCIRCNKADKTLSKLQNLTLKYTNFQQSFDLGNFLSRCEELKSVSFKTHGTCKYIKHLVATILDPRGRVERISIEAPRSPLQDILQSVPMSSWFGKLKFFSLSGQILSVVSFIEQFSECSSLEELVLNLFWVPDPSECNFVEKLDKFRNLKECKINFIWNTLDGNGSEGKPYLVPHLREYVNNFYVMEGASSIVPAIESKLLFRRTYALIFSRK